MKLARTPRPSALWSGMVSATIGDCETSGSGLPLAARAIAPGTMQSQIQLSTRMLGSGIAADSRWDFKPEAQHKFHLLVSGPSLT